MKRNEEESTSKVLADELDIQNGRRAQLRPSQVRLDRMQARASPQPQPAHDSPQNNSSV
jgi:hypothetical protein